MNVFISWAEKDSLSHEGALLLQKWLPEVLHNLDFFVSSEDIASGSLWLQKLFEQLDKAESGILCVTKESLDRNWILFEAGALAKRAGTETGRVCPLLFEFKTLNFPLAAFQAHSLDKSEEPKSKKEMFQLTKTLNQNRSDSLRLDETQLERQFNRCWTEFWKPYTELCEKHTRAKAPHTSVKITNEDILSEMRGAIRQIADALTELRRAQPEQISTIRQFSVICPVCQKGNDVEMPDHPGATKTIVCRSCSSYINVHVNADHSAFARSQLRPALPLSIDAPLSVEAVSCPACQEVMSLELPTQIGATRTLQCARCNRKLYVHRASDGVFARIGNNSDWWSTLHETQAWVDPKVLIKIMADTVKASAEKTEGRDLTPDDLTKKIIFQVDKAPLGYSRTAARTFVKLVFLGGAFKFPAGLQNATWRTPFTNILDENTLLHAYARAVVRRLRANFSMTSTDLPDLQKLLFPAEMAGTGEALRQALAEPLKKSKSKLDP